jgi:hypothetical protein
VLANRDVVDAALGHLHAARHRRRDRGQSTDRAGAPKCGNPRRARPEQAWCEADDEQDERWSHGASA